MERHLIWNPFLANLCFLYIVVDLRSESRTRPSSAPAIHKASKPPLHPHTHPLAHPPTRAGKCHKFQQSCFTVVLNQLYYFGHGSGSFWPRIWSILATHVLILATRLHHFGHDFGVRGQTFWPRNIYFWPRLYFGHGLATHAYGCSAACGRPKCGLNWSFAIFWPRMRISAVLSMVAKIRPKYFGHVL